MNNEIGEIGKYYNTRNRPVSVHAQTINTNGTWEMTILDDQGNLFADLTGDVDGNGFCDYPDTTEEGLVISLLDGSGDQLPSNYYDVTVTTYPAVGSSKAQVIQPLDLKSGGASSKKRRYYLQKNVGDGKNWVITYMQIFGQPNGSGEDPPAQLTSMMVGAAQIIHDSQYGINNDSVINQINTTWGLPLTFTLDHTQDWSYLQNLLEFSEAKKFVYLGHSGPHLIGRTYGDNMNTDYLKTILQNHPYRFVFLYGCESAKGDLAEAFGIKKKKWKNNKAGLTSQAFLGWKTKRHWFYGNFLPAESENFFEGFWREWRGTHPNLQDAIDYAYRVTNYDPFASDPTEPCPDAKEIVLYGDPTLPFYH